jgi:uncharacterized protein YeaO (DUF488 family)
LRKWYSHDPYRWDQFRKEYFKELDEKQEFVAMIMKKKKAGNISLLFSSREEKLNNAIALKEYLEAKGEEVVG